MTTNKKNNNIDTEIQKKLDIIKSKSKYNAKLMATKLKAKRNEIKTP